MKEPEPYFKKSHACYYVQLNGKQIRLAREPEVAWKRYHELMAGRRETKPESGTVAALVEDFLAWTKEHKAASTYDWYAGHCRSFTSFAPKLTIEAMKPLDVTRWLKESYSECANRKVKTACSDTYKNGAVRAISRAFNWGIGQGIIDRNPLAKMERPPASPRECCLSAEQWDELLAALKPGPVEDIVLFLSETGCRPYEARTAHARHWDRENNVLVFERKNSKGKRYRRVIYLNDTATAIVGRRASKGLLFLDEKSEPWTKYSLLRAFAKISKKVGFHVFPYLLRHSWVTRALEREIDLPTVAALAGHRGTKMVSENYNHVDKNLTRLVRKSNEAVA